MTAIGYGDVTPINPFEVFISIFVTLFSSCIFASVYNKIQ